MNIVFPAVAILAPLFAALMTAVPRRFISALNYRLGFLALVASFMASSVVLWNSTTTTAPFLIPLFQSPWTVLPSVELSVDRLSAVMMTVISAIGMVLYRYSIRYLQQDAGQPRFHALLSLAVFTLLWMVSSADLLMLFMAWQLLSWILCLLSHNFAHLPTAQSSFRTFIMLRAGDVSFLSGIALAYHLYGTIEFKPLFEQAASNPVSIALWGSGMEVAGATAVTLLIFVGAMSKSAQFPLHMWLPDSLYAPTPIHGLLHAGIINAGGFLLNRMAPLYILSPSTLHLVLFIGLATMLMGKSMMLVKNDIKKTLGYSTIGQMGYMIMECGVGAFSLAVFHLIAHGLFKATVFLNCGDVIHKARLEPEHPFQPSPDSPGFFGWLTGFLVSLMLPFGIVTGAHYLLGIDFLDSQGMFLFLLFSWVTASHAMLTLFRLQNSWTMVLAMLLSVSLVSTAYFFSAEAFTHFLYPDSAFVAASFAAARLSDGVFYGLAGGLVLSIFLSWFGLYLHYHDKFALHSGSFWNHVYILFINRLYLDAFVMRLLTVLKRAGRKVDQSRFTLPIVVVMALFFAWQKTGVVSSEALSNIGPLLAAALLLPLFPLHGVYLSALTRVSGKLAVVAAVAMPILGTWLVPALPREILPGLGVLAAFGALWGSLKAVIQIRISCRLAYGGMALSSILWWHLAQVGKLTAQGLLFVVAASLAIGGLMYAWERLRSRFGDLDLNEIGGLFKPMPRFALCMALLVMAASGLPPFGLFYGYLAILVSPSTTMSLSLVAMVVAWFAASWYSFKLMQLLLFGPCRQDLRYKDLGGGEVAGFAVVIALLVVLGGLPQTWLETAISSDSRESNISYRVTGGSQWTR